MSSFINDSFLLQSDAARKLYFEHAAELPVIDYHCHLNPGEIAEDKTWDNIAQIWLAGDHYKWRAMRSNGVAEKFCTGDASDRGRRAGVRPHGVLLASSAGPDQVRPSRQRSILIQATGSANERSADFLPQSTARCTGPSFCLLPCP